jgi:hypothetical protein
MAEYCDTPQSKERRNREYKVCLNERAILRLLDYPFAPLEDKIEQGLSHVLIAKKIYAIGTSQQMISVSLA